MWSPITVAITNARLYRDAHYPYNAIYDLSQPMPAIYAELRKAYPTPYPKPRFAKQTASTKTGLNAIVNFVQAKYHRAAVENADDA